jgi:hypothetical protein
MSQVNDQVIKEAYNEYNFENLGLRAKEVENLDFRSAADQLFGRIDRTKHQIGNLGHESWKEEFVEICERKKHVLSASWEAAWRDECDGKRLFDDLYRRRQFRLPQLKLKKKMIQLMRTRNTANWQSLQRLLTEFLNLN